MLDILPMRSREIILANMR
jgi:hypothetical protein